MKDNMETYRSYVIFLKKNESGWDYVIPGLTTEGYDGDYGIYGTKEDALEKAKKRIDLYMEGN